MRVTSKYVGFHVHTHDCLVEYVLFPDFQISRFRIIIIVKFKCGFEDLTHLEFNNLAIGFLSIDEAIKHDHTCMGSVCVCCFLCLFVLYRVCLRLSAFLCDRCCLILFVCDCC